MPLISRRLLNNQSFLRDFDAFLGTSSQVFAAISELGNSDVGFSVENAQQLSELGEITSDEARSILIVAGHIYDAITDQEISVEDAVAEILEISTGREVETTGDIGQAMSDLFAYKPAYEKGKDARDRAVAIGPHFISFEGNWTISIHRTREKETVKIPSIAISVIWHDEPGTSHEAYFKMTDTEWTEFVEKVEEISTERKNIQEFL